MRHEVLRIEPRSAMRIGFFVGLLGGFVLGLVETLILRAMSGASAELALPAEAKQLIESGTGALLLVALITGLASSLIVALVGGLTAVFYNMGARMFGGFELSLSDPPESPIPDVPEQSGEDESDD